MKPEHQKNNRRIRRAARTRARIHGTAQRPRLSVFRSNRHIAAQLIDDVARTTMASASDRELAKSAKKGASLPMRRERALWVGRTVAERALAQKIRTVTFDRGRYRYHGVVAALAEGARAAGLRF